MQKPPTAAHLIMIRDLHETRAAALKAAANQLHPVDTMTREQLRNMAAQSTTALAEMTPWLLELEMANNPETKQEEK